MRNKKIIFPATYASRICILLSQLDLRSHQLKPSPSLVVLLSPNPPSPPPFSSSSNKVKFLNTVEGAMLAPTSRPYHYHLCLMTTEESIGPLVGQIAAKVKFQ